jgi:lysyl-tRNA synthetase class II
MLEDQEKAVVRQQENRRDLSDALADLDRNDQMAQAVTWEDGAKGERDVEVNDPFTLPPADPSADAKYLGHLDQATRLRRRVLELLLYAGTSGSLHTLDGLELRPSLGEDSPDMGKAWTKLEELGVLRRKAITRRA